MKTVLCYGDSNTYGYDPKCGGRYPKNIRWPGALQLYLGDGYTVIEEGCNGRTTVFEEPGAEWKCGLPYLKPCLNTHKPIDVFCLMLGTNDLKKCFNASAMDIAEGVGVLIGTVKSFTKEKQGFIPAIIVMAPPRIGKGIDRSFFSFEFDQTAVDRSEKFEKEFLRVAKAEDCIFFNAGAYADPSEEDSLHLTEEGHKAIAKALAEVIESLG